jgi:hypothetical protein
MPRGEAGLAPVPFGPRPPRHETECPGGDDERPARTRQRLATLAAAMAGVLRRRGVADPAASLAAEAGIAAFRIAFERWIREGSQPGLPRIIRESLDELKAVTAGRYSSTVPLTQVTVPPPTQT